MCLNTRRLCEGCNLKCPSFGCDSTLPTCQAHRASAGCAPQAASTEQRVSNHPRPLPPCRLPTERKRRWCGGCAKDHPAAVSKLKQTKPAGTVQGGCLRARCSPVHCTYMSSLWCRRHLFGVTGCAARKPCLQEMRCGGSRQGGCLHGTEEMKCRGGGQGCSVLF